MSPPATLSAEALERIRADCFADDVEIDVERMQHWSDSEAARYFSSGGASAAPPRLHDVRAVLAEAGVEHLVARLADERLCDWIARLRGSRNELLRRLRMCGVASLSERQAVVNALAKAWRETRIPAEATRATSTLPALPPPVELWREAVQAVEELRALTPPELTCRLPSDELRAMCLPPLRPADAALTAAQATHRFPPDVLGDTLEALGWPLERVRLLLDGSGMSTRESRPWFGEPLAFWTNQMFERGTEVALYDYADYAERVLGMTAWVVHPPGGFPGCVAKFRARFGSRVVELHWEDVGGFLVSRGIEALYVIKEGTQFVPDVRSLPASVRALVHCVFHAKAPHGEVYAKISPCVAGEAPVVPHIVRPREQHGPDMRSELGIPREAVVFGRHGGWETFSIDFARDAVLEVARARHDVYFLFLNTCPLHELLPNIIYLERTLEQEEVSRFVRTCDAMLHARDGGETFGLAVAEFSAHNRPVLASAIHHDDGQGRMHLDVLGSVPTLRSYFYRDHASLVRLLMSFERRNTPADCNAYRAFEPRAVMATFERVFLSGLPQRTKRDVLLPDVIDDEEMRSV